MLGIRTRGRKMVGADETTELWRPPNEEIHTYLRRDRSNIHGQGYPGRRGRR